MLTGSIKTRGPRTPAASSSSVAPKSMKDQSDDSEFTAGWPSNADLWYQRYVNLMVAHPQDEEDAAVEQFSALHRRVQTLQQPPYVDMAAWLPTCSVGLEVQGLDPDGEWHVPGAGIARALEIRSVARFLACVSVCLHYAEHYSSAGYFATL